MMIEYTHWYTRDHSYIPGFLLGVAVTLDPEPTPT
jgi:hypothetical protein